MAQFRVTVLGWPRIRPRSITKLNPIAPIAASIISWALSLFVCFTIFMLVKKPQARCWSLSLMFLCSISAWFIIGVTLLDLHALQQLNLYALDIGRDVGAVVLIALGTSIPLSLILSELSPKLMLAQVEDLKAAPKDLRIMFMNLACRMQLPSPELRVFKNSAPISFVLETERPTVILSDRIISLLTKNELETVMAHELAHVKHSDTLLKAMLTAFRTSLPLDPIIRFIEPAFHREREILADEVAARATQKPLSLASALLKIHESFPEGNLASHSPMLLGLNFELTNRYPSVSHRVARLILIGRGII